MSLIKRTWPYGTKRSVRVLTATPRVLIVADALEAFAMVGHGVSPLPAEDTKGTITFTKGGPSGGYWQFTSGN